MSEVDKVTDKAINEGGVLTLLYFDIHGNSKEGLQNLGVGFIQKILKEPGVIYARGQIEEPIKEEELYSTSVEVKVLTKSFIDLTRICGAYSPFSVEILRPYGMKFSLDMLHDLLMQISTTTYEYKKYIFEKTSTKEDLEKYQKNMRNKMKLGKNLLEKKKKK